MPEQSNPNSLNWSQSSSSSSSSYTPSQSLSSNSSHLSTISLNDFNQVRLVNPSIRSTTSSIFTNSEQEVEVEVERKLELENVVKRKSSMWSLNSISTKWSSNKASTSTSKSILDFNSINFNFPIKASSNSIPIISKFTTSTTITKPNDKKKKTRVSNLSKNNLKEGVAFGAKNVSRKVISGFKTVKKSFSHPNSNSSDEDQTKYKKRKSNTSSKEEEEEGVLQIRAEVPDTLNLFLQTERSLTFTPTAPPTVISLRTHAKTLRFQEKSFLNRSPRSAKKIINRGRPIHKDSMTNRPLSPRFDLDPERGGENDCRRSPPRTPANRLRRGIRKPLSPLSLDSLSLSPTTTATTTSGIPQTILRPQFSFFQRAQDDDSISFMSNSIRSGMNSINSTLEEGISEFLSELKGEDENPIELEQEKIFEIRDEVLEQVEVEVEDEEEKDIEGASICTARSESMNFSTNKRISNPSLSFLVDDAERIQSQILVNPFVFTAPPVILYRDDSDTINTPTPLSRTLGTRRPPLLNIPTSVRRDPTSRSV